MMNNRRSYSKIEESKQVDLLKDGTINDPGGRNGCPHCLQNVRLNFYDGIVDDVIAYFYDVKGGNYTAKPDMQLSAQVLNGNLKSSQACCFNHLFVLRKKENKKLASAVLRKIDARIEEAVLVDTGLLNLK